MRRWLIPMAILLLTSLCAHSSAQQAAPASPAADSRVSAANPNDFVGADVCASCHEAEAKGFATNPHSKIALMHGNSGVTCENCHGLGKAHVEAAGDVTKIFNPGKGSAKQVDATCLTCHAGAHPDFERSPHARAGVGCVSCHSVHASKQETLLKAPQPALCYQCHADQKAQFNMPIHHRVNEGLIQCTDCHEVHGTFGPNNLRTTADQNAVCTKCHTDIRGPFVYEHPPVRIEGCETCHYPHGSTNTRLLRRPVVFTLCLQCHNGVAGFGTRNANETPLSRNHNLLDPKYQNCTTCHVRLHGSNSDFYFLR